MSQEKTHERDPQSFKELKGMDFAVKVYHDISQVGQVATDIEKIKSLSKALTDLVENADIPILDQIRVLQNTTLRVIYKNTLDVLDMRESEEKAKMCEDLK
jgi:hypothetical protein